MVLPVHRLKEAAPLEVIIDDPGRGRGADNDPWTLENKCWEGVEDRMQRCLTDKGENGIESSVKRGSSALQEEPANDQEDMTASDRSEEIRPLLWSRASGMEQPRLRLRAVASGKYVTTHQAYLVGR
ncbi:hypothetical protein NDU88_006154 [Pleurodeles waltl]|uniref:Uncharacterized protein n=1 Tax=Pleurodeles waltl TaxID=8319 RepID=A0AAV7X0B9_PLEWA|nr:hypothetical protein NDU88_006154 [Pleurodeles waltl]